MAAEKSGDLSKAIELTGGGRSTDDLRLEFERLAGREPAGIWAAPGRVNLMGDHTDYNDGYVLPIAIDRSVRVAASARSDSRIRVWSLQMEEGFESDLEELRPGSVAGWAAYPCGAAWALGSIGLDPKGCDLLVDSTLPPGAGLASSAALVTTAALAVSELGGERLHGIRLAQAAHRAEVEFAGVPCGVMDQTISVLARHGQALLLDCESGHYEHVPFGPAQVALALVVVDTGVAHRLADGEYAARRKACVDAAAALGIPTLRDVGVEDLSTFLYRLPDAQSRRVRHVVSENARVLQVVEALAAADFQSVGRMFLESHESLRMDYEVSTAELDAAVRVAMEAGAIGARMTGAGLGGSAIALIDRDSVDLLAHAERVAFRRLGFPTPRVFAVEPAAGAHRVA